MKSARIALVVSRFNETITEGLLKGCLFQLKQKGVEVADFDIHRVPGAFEIPLIAQTVACDPRVDAIIALGCVIKGDTFHFEMISLGVTMGIQQASLETGKPILFGVLTTQTEEQAIARSHPEKLETNKGAEAARACLEMLDTLAGCR